MSKFAKSDLLLLVVGVTGLAAFLLLYSSVFPQANVRLEVTRGEATDIAEAFLADRGATAERFKRVVVFFGDDVGLHFLQRNLGLEEASRIANEEVAIWAWEIRWFRPQEKEEWIVLVGVDGTIIGFSHVIEEAAAGADLEPADALVRAQDFLAARNFDLGGWERTGESSQQRDNRTDHLFTWDLRGAEIEWSPDDPEAGSGGIRMSVRVQGDEVGSFNHYLRIPEEYSRQYAETLSVGTVLALAAFGITAILSFVAIGIAFVRVRKEELDWKPAISLGVLVGLLLLLFNGMNWPTLKSTYPTEFSWAAYIGVMIIALVLLSALYGAIVLFMTAAGTSLSEEVFPGRLAGFREAATGNFLHPSIAAASLRGYGLGFGFIGYLTLFYWFAQRYMGAWLPAEGPYSQVFDLYWPFLAPLAISLVAAVSEEVTYRLFGVSFFKRYLKSTALALLIPAAIWAFAHSTYPVYPVYLRGIELTIGGVIFGIAYVRLGLLTCIVAHYVVDAFLLGAPLLATGNTVYVVSGAIALVPAALGFFARITAQPGTTSNP